MSGVYLAEKLNRFLGAQWQSFATQNYFDPHGIFISILWSGPLLVIAMLILVSILNLFLNFAINARIVLTTALLLLQLQVNTLFSLCHLIVRWKRAELRHRARLQKKEN